MERKTYRYVNDLGRAKEINISKSDTGNLYRFAIWDLQSGELTQSGETTHDEIRKFLAHYRVAI